jgi:ATP-binding cassette subfamily C (CFTR/MRP) protein 1
MQLTLGTSPGEDGDKEGALSPNSTSSDATADRLLALSRINLKAGPGELIAIVGQVGSGKSSILSAVLGDMKLCFGSVSKRGRVAYVGQRPFIQNSTLRDNITFGQPHNEEKYQRTLEQSALIPDLAVLPGGDLTEIGERGINLSGKMYASCFVTRITAVLLVTRWTKGSCRDCPRRVCRRGLIPTG